MTDATGTTDSDRRLQIAVVGAGTCDEDLAALAFDVGWALASAGAVVVNGGRSGVMAAASAGARAAGGTVVGILPGSDARATPPNPDVDIAVFTGLGQARNLTVVLSASVLIAIGGGWGTLSEIALARKHDRPVVLLESWDLTRPTGGRDPGLHRAASAEQAAQRALALAARRTGRADDVEAP